MTPARVAALADVSRAGHQTDDSTSNKQGRGQRGRLATRPGEPAAGGTVLWLAGLKLLVVAGGTAAFFDKHGCG